MREAKQFLKDDGILFLGVPMGKDCLLWNANRIYGEQHLPLLLKGWALLDIYNSYGRLTPDFPFDCPEVATTQPLMVLKNIKADYPDDTWFKENLVRCAGNLKEACQKSTGNLRDSCLLARLLHFIYDFKRKL